MPHPKMDALVESLAGTWRTGRKALVFVRRVASVTELGRKLDERYDTWLINRLRRELPAGVQRRFEQIVERYRNEKSRVETKARRFRERVATRPRGRSEVDTGGYETFFAWFFRGEGPQGIVSGATIQQRLGASGGTYGTFFKDNHVATLLGCEPGTVRWTLATALGMTEEDVGAAIHERSRLFLSRAKKWPRGKRFEAVQAATLQLLVEHPACSAAVRDSARVAWEAWYRDSALPAKDQASEAPAIEQFLEEPTFFTALRRRPELRAAIWPASTSPDPTEAFREQELRSHMLAAASRLGHSLIDLYTLAIGRLGSLKKGVQDVVEDQESAGSLASDYLDRLEHHMRTPLEQRDFSAFDELSEIAAHFELILDVNEPGLREASLREGPLLVARLLREQQPVGGMSGQVNQTLVRQFRMPGYPFVLVTTDVLQEGEDLHTFCSAVHHYGISWTPSSMEQRTGRIDRVRSESDRRLSGLTERSPTGDEKLQVFFPHLEDTVEVLQVQRVLDQVIRAVEFLFGFTLAAGLVVLFAAITATREERAKEFAIMRAVGARASLLRQVQRAELVGVGLLAGFLASVVALGVGWGLARYVFDFAWTGSWTVPLMGSLAGAALALAAGWWGLRSVLNTPVVETLRKAQ